MKMNFFLSLTFIFVLIITTFWVLLSFFSYFLYLSRDEQLFLRLLQIFLSPSSICLYVLDLHNPFSFLNQFLWGFNVLQCVWSFYIVLCVGMEH